MKRCTKCGLEKLLIEFHKNRDGLVSRCRSCVAAYYEANKKAISARKKNQYEANKEVILARHKIYAKANKKAILAQKKAYHKANKEMILPQKKIYRATNREAIAARKKIYYKANKKAISAQHKIYRKANQKTMQLKIKSWREQNPERHAKHVRTQNARRRARIYGAVMVPFTAAMQAAQYAAQRGLCYYRNEELNGIYDIEHKIPLSRGGTHTPDNIVLACERCNNEKWMMTDAEFFELIRAESVEKVA